MAKMIPNTFMTDLATKLKEDRKIADTTVTQYLQTLYKLNGSQQFKSLAWCKNFEAVQSIIDTYAPSTQRTQYQVLSSTLSLVKNVKAYKASYLHWWNKMAEANKEKRAEPIHEKTEKEKGSILAWDDILAIKNSLREKVEKFATKKSINPMQFNELFHYMLMALYTEMPPRRNQDYFYMCVVPKWNDTMDKTMNYYDVSTGKFIFNKYKTAKTYGAQIIDVPESLRNCLKLCIKFHPLGKTKSFPLIVKPDGTQYKNASSINRFLNAIFDGKKVGSSALRHSYLSSKYGDITKEREEVAKEMGHSVAMADSYIKY